jgi:hypothetical protein
LTSGQAAASWAPQRDGKILAIETAVKNELKITAADKTLRINGGRQYSNIFILSFPYLKDGKPCGKFYGMFRGTLMSGRRLMTK